jgi:hypothetical protein
MGDGLGESQLMVVLIPAGLLFCRNKRLAGRMGGRGLADLEVKEVIGRTGEQLMLNNSLRV